MIKIKIEKENNKILNISFLGHALHDDYGKDIVCASVSSIVITTINAIQSIDKDAINYEEKPLIIIINKHDLVTIKLIENMINLLSELSNDYPKNINIL